MSPIEPRTRAALDTAAQKVRATVVTVAGRVGETLAGLAESSARLGDRDLLVSTQFELRRNADALHRAFAQALREKIDEDLTPRVNGDRTLATANWQTLSLVGDAEMDERMYADRIGQQISHACDVELREMASYIGGLLHSGRVDLDRNPLRPELLGAVLYRSLETVSRDPEARQLLSREFGRLLAAAMPECYSGIVQDLQARGVQPLALTARGVEGPGLGGNSGYATLSGSRSHDGEFDPTPFDAAPDSGAAGATRSGIRSGATSHGGASLGSAAPSSRGGPGSTAGSSGGGTGAIGRADAQLLSLLRRLTAVNSRAAELSPTPAGRGAGAMSQAGAFPRAAQGADTRGGGSGFGAGGADTAWRREITGPPSPDGGAAAGLMAVNLIRAHRDELVQASSGQLDHMVIDVVGSLFDQILSDSRVPPQMARQIARLQLPVLRVALRDPTFFSSRRHPVRRFVNRIASLACAFDDFEQGPGLAFLNRVRELVQEIVDGDFDQIEIYAAQLGELERFIAEETGRDTARSGAAATLDRKEGELRLQQRYRMQLHAALSPLALPPYLNDFLPQVWSQALVLASSRDGADSELAQRFRRAARDLVLSVQPKGSPAMRKKFLMQLSPLMKDLHEGMRLVGWPEQAQRGFLARLLPAHAESMKAVPLSELDYNMMARRLESIFASPVAAGELLSPSDPLPDADADADVAGVERRFTDEEASKVGLVTEAAVDWSTGSEVDIDLGDPADAVPAEPQDSRPRTAGAPALDTEPGEPPAELSRGSGLMAHVRLGFAYQMLLKDEWQKVRLTHVSAGRSFFVFSCGHQHQETISMTARMLARMCESGRMRAVESAYLMERATQRARRQLAELKTTARPVD